MISVWGVDHGEDVSKADEFRPRDYMTPKERRNSRKFTGTQVGLLTGGTVAGGLLAGKRGAAVGAGSTVAGLAAGVRSENKTGRKVWSDHDKAYGRYQKKTGKRDRDWESSGFSNRNSRN